MTVMPLPPIDLSIKLSDQLGLAYAEYGESEGIPVILVHDLPGFRLSWGNLPDHFFPSGLRIVAPDRSGYDCSDPKPERTLLDGANDETELADALEIETFVVVGVSGRLVALACAWQFLERLTSVGIVSYAAPTNVPSVFAGTSKTD